MRRLKLQPFSVKLLALPLVALMAASCIQDEALNTEADIEHITLPGDVLNRDAEFGDAIYEADGTPVYPIILYLKKGTDIVRLAPELKLTPGATVEPPSGTPRNFRTPQYYTVTSEDGKWQRRYRIEVSSTSAIGTFYHFEDVRLGGGGKYHIFYETDDKGEERLAWSSANPGYALTDINVKTPEQFPTYQWSEGKSGKCVKLVTLKTGSLGSSVNMPIASGNLFLGTFNVGNALTNALQATQFGLQYENVPTYLRGWYKYRSGDTFYELDKTAKDKLKPIPGRKDVFNIYAVFYENTDENRLLDGTNVLAEDNEQIVSTAVIDNARETDEWTEFYLPFIYRPGKSIDPVKLASGGYNLTIVFASSLRGDYFEGAPGSTLLVDEVELGYE